MHLKQLSTLAISTLFFDVDALIANIKNSFRGTNEFKMLIAFAKENLLYHFDGVNMNNVDYFADIGSGSRTAISTELKDHLKIFDEHLRILDGEYYLATVLSFLQGYSITNKMIHTGVGGAFYGLFSEKVFEWFSDTCYQIFENDMLNPKAVSMASRDNNIYIQSDLDKTTRIFLNQLTNTDIPDVSDVPPNEIEGIRRLLITKCPKYIMFYNAIQNHMIITVPDGWMYNDAYCRWIKREDNEVHYAYVFSEQFVEFCNRKLDFADGNPTISLYPLFQNENYEYSKMKSDPNVSTHMEMLPEVDLDFTIMPTDNFPTEFITQLSCIVQQYKNIVLMDLDYLVERIREKAEADLHNIVVPSNISLEEFPKVLTLANMSKDYNDYLFLITNKRDTKINGFSMKDWISEYIFFSWGWQQNQRSNAGRHGTISFILLLFCGNLFSFRKNSVFRRLSGASRNAPASAKIQLIFKES